MGSRAIMAEETVSRSPSGALVGKSRDQGAGAPRGLLRRINSEPDWNMLRTPLSQTTQRFFRERALARTLPCFQARLYATEAPWVRPPYRPAPTDQPPAETFASPSKPRQYYARPASKRELPIIEVNLNFIRHTGGWLTFTTMGCVFRLVAQMARADHPRDIRSRCLGRVHKVRE